MRSGCTEPRPVAEIPGFPDGDVSVQDAGAQLAAAWLDARPGMRVLDACAAPGGKTAHLAELGATDLFAVEVDAARAERITENLRRANLSARVIVGDAAHPDTWIAASGGQLVRPHPARRTVYRFGNCAAPSRHSLVKASG